MSSLHLPEILAICWNSKLAPEIMEISCNLVRVPGKFYNAIFARLAIFSTSYLEGSPQVNRITMISGVIVWLVA